MSGIINKQNRWRIQKGEKKLNDEKNKQKPKQP